MISTYFRRVELAALTAGGASKLWERRRKIRACSDHPSRNWRRDSERQKWQSVYIPHKMDVLFLKGRTMSGIVNAVYKLIVYIHKLTDKLAEVYSSSLHPRFPVSAIMICCCWFTYVCIQDIVHKIQNFYATGLKIGWMWFLSICQL